MFRKPEPKIMIFTVLAGEGLVSGCGSFKELLWFRLLFAFPAVMISALVLW